MTKKNVTTEKETINYGFYSKVLQKPFDSLSELQAAEQEYYDKLKAKEDKAAEKKSDAALVEEAYKNLNAARKNYKDNLTEATKIYSKGLAELKEGYEKTCKNIKDTLATAEVNYSNALKAFTEKYPEGYHITLKDGDFETTISSQTVGSNKTKISDDFVNSFLNLFFNH